MKILDDLQPSLFESTEIVIDKTQSYHIPKSEDAETPFCYDCKSFNGQECKTIKRVVDDRGTCGLFEYRSKETRLKHLAFIDYWLTKKGSVHA